jgi:hypothetical protein
VRAAAIKEAAADKKLDEVSVLQKKKKNDKNKLIENKIEIVILLKIIL